MLKKAMNKITYGILATVTAVGFYYGAVYNQKSLNTEKRSQVYECKEPYVKFDKWDCRNEVVLNRFIASDSILLKKFNTDRRYWYVFFRALSVAEGIESLDPSNFGEMVSKLEDQTKKTGKLYTKRKTLYWDSLNRRHPKHKVFRKSMNGLFRIYFPKKK